MVDSDYRSAIGVYGCASWTVVVPVGEYPLARVCLISPDGGGIGYQRQEYMMQTVKASTESLATRNQKILLKNPGGEKES